MQHQTSQRGSWHSMSGVQHFTSAVYTCVRETPSTTGRNRCFTFRDKPPTDSSLRVETLVVLHDCETIHHRDVAARPDAHGTPCEKRSTDPAVTDKTRYHTFHSPRVRSSPKLCWLEKVKRHRDTSRCGQRSDRREQCERRGRCTQG